MWFFTFVVKSLLRQPARSSFTAIGIGLAVAAMVSLVSISSGFERSYLNLYAQRGIDLVVQRSGRTQQLGNEMDESYGDRIRKLPGVDYVIGGLVDVVSFEEADLWVVVVNGWPIDSPVFEDITITAGRSLRADDENQLLLGRVLAGNLGKHAGDTVELYGQSFTVAGIFESSNVYENGSVVIVLPVLQELTEHQHQVSGITVIADPNADPATIENLKRRIEGLGPELSVLSTSDFVAGIKQIRVARAMAWITSAVAMVLGGIGVLNTMAMSVLERTREFGLLRALGWPRWRVVRTIFIESAMLALAGAVLGSMLGVLLPKMLGQVRTMSGLIEGNTDPLALLEGFGIALLMGIAGAAYPAYRGASLRPIDALRHK